MNSTSLPDNICTFLPCTDTLQLKLSIAEVQHSSELESIKLHIHKECKLIICLVLIFKISRLKTGEVEYLFHLLEKLTFHILVIFRDEDN